MGRCLFNQTQDRLILKIVNQPMQTSGQSGMVVSNVIKYRHSHLRVTQLSRFSRRVKRSEGQAANQAGLKRSGMASSGWLCDSYT